MAGAQQDLIPDEVKTAVSNTASTVGEFLALYTLQKFWYDLTDLAQIVRNIEPRKKLRSSVRLTLTILFAFAATFFPLYFEADLLIALGNLLNNYGAGLGGYGSEIIACGLGLSAGGLGAFLGKQSIRFGTFYFYGETNRRYIHLTRRELHTVERDLGLTPLTANELLTYLAKEHHYFKKEGKGDELKAIIENYRNGNEVDLFDRLGRDLQRMQKKNVRLEHDLQMLRTIYEKLKDYEEKHRETLRRRPSPALQNRTSTLKKGSSFAQHRPTITLLPTTREIRIPIDLDAEPGPSENTAEILEMAMLPPQAPEQSPAGPSNLNSGQANATPADIFTSKPEGNLEEISDLSTQNRASPLRPKLTGKSIKTQKNMLCELMADEERLFFSIFGEWVNKTHHHRDSSMYKLLFENKFIRFIEHYNRTANKKAWKIAVLDTPDEDDIKMIDIPFGELEANLLEKYDFALERQTYLLELINRIKTDIDASQKAGAAKGFLDIRRDHRLQTLLKRLNEAHKKADQHEYPSSHGSENSVSAGSERASTSDAVISQQKLAKILWLFANATNGTTPEGDPDPQELEKWLKDMPTPQPPS